MENTHCIKCNLELQPQKRELKEGLNGNSYHYEIHVMACPQCNHYVLTYNQLFSMSLQTALNFIADGVKNGQTLRYCRKAMGLKMQDMDRLICLPMRRVSQYELGEKDIPEHVWEDIQSLLASALEQLPDDRILQLARGQHRKS